MKNTLGNNLTVTLFGESHGPAVGCVIDGIAPGIKIDTDSIELCLAQRAGDSALSTERRERDKIEFLSGVKNNITEGTPVCIVIKNASQKSTDYSSIEDTPRPSHADFTAEVKYHGYQDNAGGGHFSGRLTAPLVAAGAIIMSALSNKGITIGTHIKELHGITDRSFENFASDISELKSLSFPALDKERSNRMQKEILAARDKGDSVGGILETAVIGIPAGVGEPWFDTAEGMIAHAIFSIPAVKGIEFGDGFAFSDMLGSEANDPYTYENENVVTTKNSNGGILGGITNGMPILFKTAIKPTPSISLPQETVNLKNKGNTIISVGGRHDPAIIHRAGIVVDAITAIVLADLLVTRYGTDFLTRGIEE